MGLYVEVKGTGPALLLIPGGAGDAATFGRLVIALAGGRTTIAYDRRGYSRSPIGASEPAERFEHDVEDAARLIAEHAGGRADVFGSSSGAIVALALAARHPDKVRRVVAHEPPLTGFVDDGDEVRRGFDGVVEALRGGGVEAAMARFGDVTGLGHRPPPPRDALPAPVLEVLDRIAGSRGFWIEEELRQYTRMPLDLDGLPAGVVVGVGAGSGEQFPARAARGLARRLGSAPAEFPGGHDGYVEVPAEFTARLLEVLA